MPVAKVVLLCIVLALSGCSTSSSVPVSAPQPPMANAGGPYTGMAGIAITFSGSGSTDPQGQALTYGWNFGDSATASGVSPTHAYASAGAYTVSLIVTNSNGLSATATSKATIAAALQPPLANAGGRYTGMAGIAITFSGSDSSDPQGQALTYAWNFGDNATASGISPTHIYASAGTYTASLTVTDSSGLSATATASVIVSPTLTSITITGVTTLVVGHNLQLSATATYSDGSMKDVTSSVAWSSSMASIAAISASGLVSAVSTGQSTISAMSLGVSGTTTLTVSAKTLQQISITPVNVSLYLGANQQLSATGTYNDGSVEDITSSASWQSSDSTRATVSPTGLVTSIAAGAITVTASSSTVSASTSITILTANSGYTFVNDMTDSRLLNYQGTDGSLSTFVGSRDSSGNPTSIDNARVTHTGGSWEEVSFGADGSTRSIVTSDGTQVFFSWTSDTTANVTLVTNDRTKFFVLPLDLTSASSAAMFSPKRGSELLSRGTARQGALKYSSPTTSTTSSTLASVYVSSTCGGGVPEDGLSVHITRVGAFGGSPVLALDFGDGVYSADLGSGVVLPDPSSQALIDAANAIGPVCTEFDQLKGQIGLETALADQVCEVIPPPYDLGCLAAGAGAAALEAACSVEGDVSKTSAVINFVNSLNPTTTLLFDATFNGTELQTTLIGQPTNGPFQSGPPIQFQCPVISTVTITPASSAISIGQTESLNATALDSSSPPRILGSSGFKWQWSASPDTVASVLGLSSTSTGGIVVPNGLSLLPVGQVTGVESGTASITAVEQTQGASGSASVTVEPVNVSISPISATVSTQGTQQFVATVTGASNTAVVWSVNGISGGNATIGMVSGSGLYTAPSTIPIPALVSVTATSQADSSQSATATVMITNNVQTIISISNIGDGGLTLSVNGNDLGTVPRPSGSPYCYGIFPITAAVGSTLNISVTGSGTSSGPAEMDIQFAGVTASIYSEVGLPFDTSVSVTGCNAGGNCQPSDLPYPFPPGDTGIFCAQ